MTEEKDQKSEVYAFSDCVVDADRRELTMAGEPVLVQPKSFELLLYLIRNRHRAVDKDELQDALWPRSIVTETALTRCVMKARRAVGDDADKQAAIKTIHGHGYRFTATVDDSDGPAAASELPQESVTREVNRRPLKVIGAAAGTFVLIVAAWMFFSQPALSGPVRLAVLPVENATGDVQMDWVSTGLMALMNRMLQDGGIDVVNAREVSGLAGSASMPELVATGSDFREKLSKTAAATHVIGAKLEDNNGLYRLTYTLAGANARPTRRTMVGQEPTKLVKDVVDTVIALIVKNAPPTDGQTSVSNDEFINEAYARAMALYHEGRFDEAKSLFELIIEQEPHLFWPRYEHALTIRNLRDFDTAERDLIALRAEAQRPGLEREMASVENALGVIYWSRQRYDEARVAFNKVVEVALQADIPLRAATGYQNLGLVEKGIGNTPEAFALLQKSEQIYNDMDIQMLPGSLLNNMSGIQMQMGHFDEARAYSLRAIESFRMTGERRNEATAMNRLSDIYARQRYYDLAQETAESALSVRQELNDQYGVASSLVSVADIASQRGDFTRALQHAQQAYDIGVDIDSNRIVVPALVRIARAEARLGRPEAAAERYADIEAIARNTNDRQNIFRARLGIASTHVALGRFDEALTIANELLNESRDNDRQRDETASMQMIATVSSKQGRHDEAIRIYEEAFDISNRIDDSVVMATLHIRLAEEYLASGDLTAAAPHVEQAATQRPEDADSLKVQAAYASLSGEKRKAAELMGAARTQSGEGWDASDAALLKEYRTAAEPE